MKCVHVLRKPCAEPTVAANVLRYGTGAVNVDATRISATDPFGGGSKGSGGFAAGYASDGWQPGSALGRWPANMILQHLDGCVQEGAKKVRPGNGSGRTGVGANGFRTTYVNGERKGAGFIGSFVGEDGTETVVAWVCAPGCPAAGIDQQSGDLPVSRGGGNGYACSIFGTDTSPNREKGVVGFGDSGGASRFFKQVKP
jgi:hypothetical protein